MSGFSVASLPKMSRVNIVQMRIIFMILRSVFIREYNSNVGLERLDKSVRITWSSGTNIQHSYLI